MGESPVAPSRYLQGPRFELTTCWFGEPVVYLKMVLMTHFFAGVPGAQFASPTAVRRLRDGLPEDLPFWLAAIDPASPCGLPLPPFQGALPQRRAGNHVAWVGGRVVLASEGRGRKLAIHLAPEDPTLVRAIKRL